VVFNAMTNYTPFNNSAVVKCYWINEKSDFEMALSNLSGDRFSPQDKQSPFNSIDRAGYSLLPLFFGRTIDKVFRK
jgi:hypothetical protein